MKKLIIILVWYLFVNSSDKTNWYVTFHTEDNVVHKCPRDEYLEYQELIKNTQLVDNKYKKTYLSIKLSEYKRWEYVDKIREQNAKQN